MLDAKPSPQRTQRDTEERLDSKPDSIGQVSPRIRGGWFERMISISSVILCVLCGESSALYLG